MQHSKRGLPLGVPALHPLKNKNERISSLSVSNPAPEDCLPDYGDCQGRGRALRAPTGARPTPQHVPSAGCGDYPVQGSGLSVGGFGRGCVCAVEPVLGASVAPEHSQSDELAAYTLKVTRPISFQ